jgi:hypothetical protein
MDIYKSEKNWLEKVADIIPGLRSYRSHEHRRDTDKRLRDYIATKIDALRKEVDNLKLDLTNEKKIDLLDDVDLATRKLQKLADSVRHASYGYTGVFDQVRMRDKELDLLYTYDIQIFEGIQTLEDDTGLFTSSDVSDNTIKKYIRSVRGVDKLIQKRKTIFDNPLEQSETKS